VPRPATSSGSANDPVLHGQGSHTGGVGSTEPAPASAPRPPELLPLEPPPPAPLGPFASPPSPWLAPTPRGAAPPPLTEPAPEMLAPAPPLPGLAAAPIGSAPAPALPPAVPPAIGWAPLAPGGNRSPAVPEQLTVSADPKANIQAFERKRRQIVRDTCSPMEQSCRAATPVFPAMEHEREGRRLEFDIAVQDPEDSLAPARPL
jgi:hypothetical protein